MNYVLSKDELLFICSLSGAKSLLGIECVNGSLSLEEEKERWRKVANILREKQILWPGNEKQMHITREYARLANILSFPDQVFAILVEEKGEVSSEFIHLKAGDFVHMKGEELCEIQLYEDREEGLKVLTEKFLLSECEGDLQLYLPAASVNHAIALASAGYLQQAIDVLKVYEVEDEIVVDLIGAFHHSSDQCVIAGYSMYNEVPSEALFTCARSEKGTWVMCMLSEQQQAVLFRKNVNNALSNILEFSILKKSNLVGKGG